MKVSWHRQGLEIAVGEFNKPARVVGQRKIFLVRPFSLVRKLFQDGVHLIASPWHYDRHCVWPLNGHRFRGFILSQYHHSSRARNCLLDQAVAVVDTTIQSCLLKRSLPCPVANPVFSLLLWRLSCSCSHVWRKRTLMC